MVLVLLRIHLRYMRVYHPLCSIIQMGRLILSLTRSLLVMVIDHTLQTSVTVDILVIVVVDILVTDLLVKNVLVMYMLVMNKLVLTLYMWTNKQLEITFDLHLIDWRSLQLL